MCKFLIACSIVSSCSCILIICYLISITMSIYLCISHCVTLQISQFIELVTVSFFYMWMFTFPDTIIWWGCLFCNIPFRCFGETQMVTASWACSSSAALIALGVFSSATTMVLLFVWFFTVIRNHGGVRTNQGLLYVPGLALYSPVIVPPCEFVGFSLMYLWSLLWGDWLLMAFELTIWIT